MSYCESMERRLGKVRGQVVPSDMDGAAHNTRDGQRSLVHLSVVCAIVYFYTGFSRVEFSVFTCVSHD